MNHRMSCLSYQRRDGFRPLFGSTIMRISKLILDCLAGAAEGCPLEMVSVPRRSCMSLWFSSKQSCCSYSTCVDYYKYARFCCYCFCLFVFLFLFCFFCVFIFVCFCVCLCFVLFVCLCFVCLLLLLFLLLLFLFVCLFFVCLFVLFLCSPS